MKKHDEEKIIYLGIALENNSLQKKTRGDHKKL